MSDCTRLAQTQSGRHLKKAVVSLTTVLENISLGQALPKDLDTITSLGAYLAASHQQSAAALGKTVARVLSLEKTCFATHIENRICLTGECEALAPAPCQCACPAGIDVAGYVALIGQGKDQEAVALIRESNPFPWVCGLVCTHPCEAVCVRQYIDAPVAIKSLKAFASKIILDNNFFKNPAKAPDNGRKVCIVGAGPSGLTAAYFLSLRGYRATVFDSLPAAGGMMRVGIPGYRLPASVFEREIALIQDLGVEFRFNTRVGKDITVSDLRREGFESFYVALGAHKGIQMGIKGESDFSQVIDAIDYLHRVALNRAPAIGPRVTVIGGGDVAVDAARTAIRLGCSDVFVVYRRTRNEMPAQSEEVIQAEQEGVRFLFLKIPVEVAGCNGHVSAIRCLDARLGKPDESGRKRPIPMEGSIHTLETDAVIHAIGQVTAPKGFADFKSMTWSGNSTIEADPLTGQTGEEGVFAGGDAVTGPATVIEAIGDGKRAAENIDRYLQGLAPLSTRNLSARRLATPCSETTATRKMTLSRPQHALLDIERRQKTFEQVELALLPETARAEALRCLRCDVCIRCGRCISACREKLGFDALCLGYLDGEKPGRTDFNLTAEKCILCGACAAVCPTGAIAVMQANGQCMLNLCGTTLCRDKLVFCNDCGEVLGADRYMRYLEKQVQPHHVDPKTLNLCRTCKRKAASMP